MLMQVNSMPENTFGQVPPVEPEKEVRRRRRKRAKPRTREVLHNITSESDSDVAVIFPTSDEDLGRLLDPVLAEDRYYLAGEDDSSGSEADVSSDEGLAAFDDGERSTDEEGEPRIGLNFRLLNAGDKNWEDEAPAPPAPPAENPSEVDDPAENPSQVDDPAEKPLEVDKPAENPSEMDEPAEIPSEVDEPEMGRVPDELSTDRHMGISTGGDLDNDSQNLEGKEQSVVSRQNLEGEIGSENLETNFESCLDLSIMGEGEATVVEEEKEPTNLNGNESLSSLNETFLGFPDVTEDSMTLEKTLEQIDFEEEISSPEREVEGSGIDQANKQNNQIETDSSESQAFITADDETPSEDEDQRTHNPVRRSKRIRKKTKVLTYGGNFEANYTRYDLFLVTAI